MLVFLGLTAPCAPAFSSVPSSVDAALVDLSHLQLVHNASLVGPVDVYIDGVRVLDDFVFRTATPFLVIPSGERRIDVTAYDAADAGQPLLSRTLVLRRDASYVAALAGRGAEFRLLVQENARRESTSKNVQFFLIHGDPELGDVDVRLLNPVENNKVADLLENNFSFGEVSNYFSWSPSGYNIEVTNTDNSVQYRVFRLSLHLFGGRTLVFLVSGSLQDGVTLVGFDVNGNPIRPQVITATDEETELPTEFTLEGNYPNPFNPSTTIQVNLPETAEVSVQIIDMLGRQVMEIPAKVMEAGAKRSIEVNAVSLASGTYIYRVIANTATDTMIKTGRMTLVK